MMHAFYVAAAEVKGMSRDVEQQRNQAHNLNHSKVMFG